MVKYCIVAYLYETHLHTLEGSKCAISSGAEYIAGYKEMGYTGIMVTDHFYNGNSALSKKLSWEEWVNRFCMGYEKAKKEGDRQGLDVFFGWEETFDSGDDYLIYGLDKQWLLLHPEVRTWTRGQQYRAVKEAGGCVVQAHPFRQHYYISRIVLSTGCVDAVEVANGGHDDISYDILAYRYAKKLGIPMLAGSDIHDSDSVIYNGLFGVYSDKKLESIDDYVKLILTKNIAGIKNNNYRLDTSGRETVRLPVEVRDAQDNVIEKDWRELI